MWVRFIHKRNVCYLNPIKTIFLVSQLKQLLCPFYSIKHVQNKSLSYLKQIFHEVKIFLFGWFLGVFLLDFVFTLSRDRKWNVCTGMLVMFLISICDFHFVCSSRKYQLQHSFGNFVYLKH